MANKDMSFLGLNRPEYVPAPELLISAMAWSLARKKDRTPLEVDGQPADGLAYGLQDGAKPAGKLAIRATRPAADTTRSADIARSLVEQLGLGESQAREACQVILGEIEVRGSQRALRSTAAPLTLELALLQDVVGVVGKKNPANFALLIEQFYRLGGGEARAAGLWLSALGNARAGGVPDWLAAAITSLAPAACAAAADDIASAGQAMHAPVAARSPAWICNQEQAPFRWFAKSWTNLCSSGWVDEMPRRRWTDWATCLLRTAFGAGFLYEAHLTQSMTCALVSDAEPKDVVAGLRDASRRLLSWDELKARSASDVEPLIGSLCANGMACQGVLDRLSQVVDGLPQPKEFDAFEDGLEQWLTAARGATAGRRAEVQHEIAAALDAATYTSGPARNVRETIRYSMLGRAAFGEDDLYAVLKRAGRYAWMEPGQEWLVAIASLCSPRPKQLSRFGDLVKALHSIGIAPSTPMLVRKLEAFGLARSSHDADDAIEIQPAF